MKKIAVLLFGCVLLVWWRGSSPDVAPEETSARPPASPRLLPGGDETEQARPAAKTAMSSVPTDASAVVKETSVIEQVRAASFWLTEQPGRWGRGAGLTGANPGQNFLAHFDDRGVFVKPVAEDEAAWEWALEFDGVPAAPVGDGRTTVTYQRGPGVEEWFHHRAEGIEHGFTISRPSGAGDRLRLPLRVKTTLTQELSADRRSALFREDSGEIALRYENLLAYDARGRRLAAWMEMDVAESEAQALALCVETTDAVFPVTIDPLITRTNGMLAPPSPVAGQRAGHSVALSGHVAALCAPGAGSGVVHLFEKRATGWAWMKSLAAPGNGIFFAGRIALSGDTLLIQASENGTDTGRVYCHQRDAGGPDQWGLRATWQADQQPQGFVTGLAIEGDTAVVVSADERALYFYGRDAGGVNAWGRVKKLGASGSVSFRPAVALGGGGRLAVATLLSDGTTQVEIRRRDLGGAEAWGVEKTIAAPAANTGFGNSLALEGDLLLAGAPLRNVGVTQGAGSVYVYRRDQGGAGQWGLAATLTAPTAVEGGQFGRSVALEGATLALSALKSTASSDAPACYLFARNPGAVPTFPHVATFTDAGDALPAADNFQMVAASGETVLLGNPSFNAAGGVQNSGRALLIERLTGWWTRVASPGAAELAAGMEFGAAVAMEGDLLAVGAPGYHNIVQGGPNAGAVFIFTRGNDLWTLQRKIEGGSLTQAGDRFGASVALCGDLLAVGAPGRDSPRLLVNRPGEVYLFRQHGDDSYDWDEVRRLAPVGANQPANYGHALALDENWLAVGYPYATGGGRVYMHLRNRNGVDTWGAAVTVENPAEASEADGDNFGYSVALSGSFLVVGAPLAEGRRLVNFQLQPVTAAGRAYVYEVQDGITNFWGLKARLPITQLVNTPFGEAVGRFGHRVAIQGTQLAVGAPGENGNKGRVHVHERAVGASTVTWGRVAVVSAGELPVQDLGADVALQDGTLAAAGAWRENVGLNSPVALSFGRNRGGAAAFGLEGIVASAEVRHVDTPARGVQPARLAMWGRQLVLTSSEARTVGAASGHADVFSRQDDRWALSRTVPDPTSFNGNQAHVVDLEADRAAVGYYFTLDDPSVFILERNRGGADQWGVVKKISESGSEASGFPGRFSLSGRFLAVTASSASSLGLQFNGAVYLYEQNTPDRNGWARILRIPGGQNNERFGSDVALEGDRLLIGAAGYDLSANQANTGAAYLYERNQAAAPQWQFLKRFLPATPVTGERFGSSVALDHDLAAIGAPNYNTNRGRVYLHRRNTGGANAWGQVEILGSPVSGGRLWGDSHVALDGGWLVAGSVKDGSVPWGVGVVNVASRLDPDPPLFQLATRLLDFPAGTNEAGAVQDISGGTIVASNSNWEDGSGSRFFVFGRNVGNGGAWGLETAIDHPGHNSVAISHRTIIAGGANDIRVYQLAGSDYDTWRRRHFTNNSVNNPALEATVWGDEADPDKDGVINLLEAFAGLDPLVGPSGGEGAVMRGLGYEAATGEYWFRWRQGADELGVRATPQWSTDLVEWNGNGRGDVYATVRATADLDGGTEWEARVPLPPATKQVFWRLFVWRE